MPKKSNKKAVVVKELSKDELQKLAHAGTREAIEKIEKYLKTEKDSLRKARAQMALDECEMLYYQPRNEKEEEEFMLSELIKRRELNVNDLTMKIDNIKSKIEKLLLEKKVHEKVLAKHKNKEEEWRYNWLQDFVIMEENKLQEMEDEIEYDKAWVVEAKKMITTARYKNMPARYLEHFDFNFGKDFSGEDDCDCDDDCECGDDRWPDLKELNEI